MYQHGYRNDNRLFFSYLNKFIIFKDYYCMEPKKSKNVVRILQKKEGLIHVVSDPLLYNDKFSMFTNENII